MKIEKQNIQLIKANYFQKEVHINQSLEFNV